MVLNYDNIFEIELELTGRCNLKCKLCFSVFEKFSDRIKYNIRQFDEIKNQLEMFKNLKRILLAGLGSEPTLYPQLFELIGYLKQRNISIEIFSNGNTHDREWWKKLSQLLTPEDKVIFTVCGSTQELHSYYRVGSSLQQILDNASAFRESGNKNDYCQHILFEYNEEDLKSGNMECIFKQFSHVWKINSSAYNERFDLIPLNTGICMIKKLSDKYLNIKKSVKSLSTENNQMQCKSLELHMVTIDNFGKIYPCYLYRLFNNDNLFDQNQKLNYTEIVKYKYDFCFECERLIHMLLNKNGIQRMM